MQRPYKTIILWILKFSLKAHHLTDVSVSASHGIKIKVCEGLPAGTKPCLAAMLYLAKW